MAKNKSEFIDVSALFKSYLSKWYWFVLSVLFCVLVAFLYTRKFPRKMAVKANILIEQEDKNPLASMGGGTMSALFGSNGKVDDEIFVISSHSLYKNVIKELGLNKKHYVKDGFLKSHLAYPSFPIDVVAPGVADTLSKALLFKISVNKEGLADVTVKEERNTVAKEKNLALPAEIKTKWGNFAIVTTPDYVKGKKLTTNILFSGYDSAAEDLSEEVSAEIASKKGNVISLGINHVNALYGMDVLNNIISKYNERGVNEKNLQGEKTAAFLEDRIRLLAGDLSQSESEMQAYKESNGIVDVWAEAKYQTEKKGELETAMFEMEQQVALLKLTQEFLADSANFSEMIPTTIMASSSSKNALSKDAALQEGISAYNELVLKRIELSQNAKPNSYALSQLDKQMAMMRQNILKSSRQALNNANLALRELRAETGSAESKLGNIPRQEREYINMQRQHTIKQSIYVFLLEKQEENAMLLANSVPKGQLVDEAFTLTEPLGLSKKLLLLIAAVLGLFIPPVLLYIIKLLRSKFETREEVESRISAPILGEMCTDKSGRSLVVSPTDTTSATELFRLMRANLLFMLNGKDDKVVLMTSTRSGEGKSFISINLAASLSLLEGKRVLLVGMDIRNPQLENYLGIAPRLGLTNYLSNPDVSLESIISPFPSLKNCDVIVAGPIPPNPSELLASHKVDELFERLRTMYDYIVVDSAPVGMVSDTFSLDRIADATVYVTRVNFSTMSDLKFIEEVYDGNRLKKLSVVVNGTSAKSGYGYGYGRRHQG